MALPLCPLPRASPGTPEPRTSEHRDTPPTISRYRRAIATWDDVRRIALGLPETTEGPHFRTTSWKVAGKAFAWVRPLGKNDIRQLTERGEQVPEGEILGARVENELAKRALIEDDPGVFFTIPHFDNYAAILVRLDEIDEQTLYEVIVEAWLDRAPPKLAQRFAAEHGLEG